MPSGRRFDLDAIQEVLKTAEDEVRKARYDLAEGYVTHGIDNRLARDLLDRVGGMISAIRERLIDKPAE